MRQWYWHMKEANGEIVCEGEGYSVEHGCRAGVERIRVAFGKIKPGTF